MLDDKTTWDKLSALWQDTRVPVLETSGRKYAILSDIHLGNGKEADDFHRNEKVLLGALDYYKDEEYSLILLGDIEEFWQFDLASIRERYGKTVYSKIRGFGNDRVHRVFGNHDYEWGGFIDPAKRNKKQSSLADEALKLKAEDGKERILLVHGHQGSIESEKYAWFSRFFVRIFRAVEPIAQRTGLYGHSSATKSQITKDYERTMYSWAKENQVILVCGHSHRAISASKSRADELLETIADLNIKISMNGTLDEKGKREAYMKIARAERELEDEKAKGREIESIDPSGQPRPCYFNSGCGLYTDGITTIEIADDEIRLVKWTRPISISGRVIREEYDKVSLSNTVKEVIA